MGKYIQKTRDEHRCNRCNGIIRRGSQAYLVVHGGSASHPSKTVWYCVVCMRLETAKTSLPTV